MTSHITSDTNASLRIRHSGRMSRRPRIGLPAASRSIESAYDCVILGAEQAFTREVPMDDPNDPSSPDNLSWNWIGGGPKWRPFSGRQAWLRKGGLRVPRPPGPPPEPSKAEREQEKRAEARAERLHLVSLTNAGVLIMGAVLAAVAVVLVLVLVTHH